MYRLHSFRSSQRVASVALRLLLIVSLLSGSLWLVACGPGEDTRVARYRRAVYSSTERSRETYAATVNQGERVELVRQEGDESLVRLAGGKEAWIESKYLMQDAAVLLDDSASLFVRPSATSGEAAGDKHLDAADVVYVIEREENPEGEWLHVEGGGRGDFFRGWLRAENAPLSFSLADVAAALRLQTAIEKKDRDTLDELAGESGAIGARAAAALVDLEPQEEESEGGDATEADGEAANATDVDAESSNTGGE